MEMIASPVVALVGLALVVAVLLVASQALYRIKDKAFAAAAAAVKS